MVKSIKTTIPKSYSHGMCTTSTYHCWLNMKQRCTNPNHPAWKYYGGRGIKICKRWIYFENFLADMGHRPPKLTLERLDNDGNYEPSNCTWASWKAQNNNKRTGQKTQTTNKQVRRKNSLKI